MSCGVPDEAEASAQPEQALMPRKQKIRRADKSSCHRCRTRSMYIARSSAFCKECFFGAIVHRFVRHLYPPLWESTATGALPPDQALGTPASKSDRPAPPPKFKYAFSRPRPQSGTVLIPVSGGAGGVAMLDLLVSNGLVGRGDGRQADRTKGEKEVVWDKGAVLFVEFAGVTGMAERGEEMRVLAEERGLGFVRVRAEEVYDPELGERLGGKRKRGDAVLLQVNLGRPVAAGSSGVSGACPLEHLQTLLSRLPLPSRPAVLEAILTEIISLVASSLPDISHVLLGETSTREAQRVIAGTALGRGWALPLELASGLSIADLRAGGGKTYEDEIEGSPRIIRIKPMKDVTVKEAAIYCHLKGLETVNYRNWASSSSAGKATSLESLTEQFIARLSVTHPSTVSTINKTGDKLVFAGDIGAAERCPVCRVPAEPSAQAWKSRTALTSLLPSARSAAELRAGPGLANGSDTPPGGDGAAQGDGLANSLCYGCLTTFTVTRKAKAEPDGQGGKSTLLPFWIGEELARRRTSRAQQRDEMIASIAEFLLDEPGES